MHWVLLAEKCAHLPHLRPADYELDLGPFTFVFHDSLDRAQRAPCLRAGRAQQPRELIDDHKELVIAGGAKGNPEKGCDVGQVGTDTDRGFQHLGEARELSTGRELLSNEQDGRFAVGEVEVSA